MPMACLSYRFPHAHPLLAPPLLGVGLFLLLGLFLDACSLADDVAFHFHLPSPAILPVVVMGLLSGFLVASYLALCRRLLTCFDSKARTSRTCATKLIRRRGQRQRQQQTLRARTIRRRLFSCMALDSPRSTGTASRPS